MDGKGDAFQTLDFEFTEPVLGHNLAFLEAWLDGIAYNDRGVAERFSIR